MKKALTLFVIALCLAMVVRRINYVYHKYNLKELINHEKGNH